MANGYTRQKGAKTSRRTKVKIQCGGYKRDGRRKMRNSAAKTGKTGGY